ncbi:single-stranded-DNA-specific exonuclease RecJ [Alloalcanivorax xenomutans]|uniref:Single-stranded-DNA-specific exonuclease RecJ n=1 Tax=Alloalcanivorax xenomutans TaxID=1094342 RepID=A0A9Q3W7Q4_9GAMM|nr:single-stranded-DNA-specific exonuclease RecJ [Alloalcanivorax xenomutans]ARB47831.1 ssDNA exonuclease RecJ [Alloalcanivorax xenomutans]MCE7510441.1 single-stranded-DNA-specific exonuclease RecJ [Alloalcanivorax xenomutans]MCE7525478.1 single-stranded-DNA-specific exonuclease RecJ [Alloalcanivorax xenomutans]WOA32878.1 single-stranded-DNA-specific exonuclease RecJ [Alloalcanivorax xenomutans]SOC04545.1 single-stranded-DNA-specific exonuclease [Alloalcanivorax xenomutans]
MVRAFPTIRRRHVEIPAGLAEVPPLLARILAARGMSGAEELDLSLNRLPHPRQFGGLEQAVALLLQARREHWRVCVVGDYDADGATATAVMVKGLQQLGFVRPDYLVPDRFEYGYGLSPAIVDLARERYQPDLLITVDNGIASIDGVAAARAAGLRVLITDHHLPGDTLPDADAILNPRLCEEGFPAANLAGVGVAFYVLMALQSALELRGRVVDLLDLVALGTVADVVVLDGANRILVEQGLRRLRAGQGSPGVRALLRVAGRDPARVVAADLGFAAGPRLNAAGRLSDMSHGIECLLAESDAEAERHAQELDTINRERRGIEQGMREAAMAEVARLTGPTPPALCLHGDDWHEGVVGILASRVKEALNRPVIAFAPARQQGLLKGSGRSIPGLHLRDVLDAVATGHPGLLHKFGGHAMAAGLTLERRHLAEFTTAFQAAVAAQADEDVFLDVIDTDGELGERDITLANAELLSHRFPWGQGFPPPRFDGVFEVLNHRVVGERHLKLTLGLPDVGAAVDGIFFNAPVADLPSRIQRVEGVYRLEVNEFRGQRNPQLLFEYLQVV